LKRKKKHKIENKNKKIEKYLKLNKKAKNLLYTIYLFC